MKTFEQFINESKEEMIVIDKDGIINNEYFKKGDKVWLKDGVIHRENGPAVETVKGYKVWYKNGELHREDGPAMEDFNRTKYWYKNGKLHREDGPALEFTDGKKFWYKNGKLHRLNGPAIEEPNGRKDWYINNKLIEKWEELEINLLLANNNIHDLIKYPEIREKLQQFKYLLKPEVRILLNLTWSKKI